MNENKQNYLQRFWLTVIAAAVLATWPHYMWIVRFLTLCCFAILAGWANDAMRDWQAERRGKP